LHGAAHHRPQRFQVMARKSIRPITCGEVRVEFAIRKDLEKVPVVEMNTPRGTMLVSSPETTALELVGYADHCGGFSNVAAVLAELAEVMAPSKLLAGAQLCPIVWSQRLGYLLEKVNHTELSNVLAGHVRERVASYAPLVRAKSMAGAPRAKTWNLAINTNVEVDP